MSELWRQSATELARSIADREVCAAEVVDAHLARIDAVNPPLNAVVRVLAEEARAAARQADDRLAAGEPVGPLHGVPFTVKLNIDVAGQPTTWGVPALADAVAQADAPTVERMRAAGAILIGRTNLPDMALRFETVSTLYGRTRNPWHPGRTTGGSSGGEAAALATGMSPIGLGTDIGGSLRNPAAACGIAAIRPSQGRVPVAGVVPGEDRLMANQLMDVAGPLARRVGDLRLGLRVVMGSHPRDPWSIDTPLDGRPRRRPIRVAVLAEPPDGPTDRAVAAAVRDAADVLAGAGYAVDEACPPRYADAADCWARLLVGDVASIRAEMWPIIGPDGRAVLDNVFELVPPLAGPAAWSQLMVERDAIARAWSLFMDEVPLLLSPNWTRLPFEIGVDSGSLEGTAAWLQQNRAVVPANLLGLPSVCLPAGRDDATGLPIGVLLTGARLREDLCLDAAERIEAELGLDTPIEPVGSGG